MNREKKKEQKLKLFAYGMTAPAIMILLILSLFPLIYTIKNSFTDCYLLAKESPSFIGIKNYQAILKDVNFRKAVCNTVKFTVLGVILETGFGLLTALFVNTFQKGKKVIRTMVLLPMLLPPVTVALIWQTMFSNNYGILNQILAWFHVQPINWLMDVKTAFFSILLIDVWQYMPLTFLLIYAALQTVPEVQYEAASIDGAGSFQKFLHITLPNIREAMVMVILLRTIDTFRLFDKVNILTKGGPANSTATITQYIYQYGTKNFQIGYASAASVIMTVIVLLLSAGYLKQALKQGKM